MFKTFDYLSILKDTEISGHHSRDMESKILRFSLYSERQSAGPIYLTGNTVSYRLAKCTNLSLATSCDVDYNGHASHPKAGSGAGHVCTEILVK